MSKVWEMGFQSEYVPTADCESKKIGKKIVYCKNKKTFNTLAKRSITSFYIIIFLAFFLVLSFLADLNWITNLSEGWKFGFSLILTFVMFIGAFVACKEMTNFFFRGNKKILLFSFLAFFIIQGVIIGLYLSHLYHNFLGLPKIDGTTFTLLMLFVTVPSIFLLAGINWLLCLTDYSYTRKSNRKYFLLFNILFCVFFFSLMYLLLTRNWTTVLMLVLLVFAFDTFSYFGGTWFGKNKMSPKISPNKTWEGAIFGSVFGVLAGLLLFYLIGFGEVDYHTSYLFFGVQFGTLEQMNGIMYSWWWYLLIILLFINLAVISVLGDLSFSFIKRKYQVKDFGKFLVGHGGLLDRVDSLSFVVVYYTIIFMIINAFVSPATLFVIM